MNDVTHDIGPRYDENFMRDIAERKQRSFPIEFIEKLHSVFSQFEYEPGKVQNVAEYIFASNVDDALEDSIPMYAFFSMCANKAREREEFFSDSIKTLESPTNAKEKISVQKGGVRRSDLYRRTKKALREQSKIRRDCESLAKAMEKRLELARTKNVNARVGMTNSWQSKQ